MHSELVLQLQYHWCSFSSADTNYMHHGTVFDHISQPSTINPICGALFKMSVALEQG